MTRSPGTLGNAFPEEGIAALWAAVRELREDVDRQKTAKVGRRLVVDGAPGIIVKNGGGIAVQDGGGITLEGGDLTVDSDGNIVIDGGNLIVTAGDITLDGGDLIVSDGVIRSGNYVAGTSGFRARDTGNLEVNDLTLRGGIIGDDALANPIRATAAHGQNGTFPVHSTDTDVVTKTITVPAGFSKAVVMAAMSATAVNHSGGVDFLAGYASIDVSGAFGGFDAAADGSDGRAIGINQIACAIGTGLSGSFNCYATLLCGSAGGWASDAFNSCNLDIVAMFLR